MTTDHIQRGNALYAKGELWSRRAKRTLWVVGPAVVVFWALTFTVDTTLVWVLWMVSLVGMLTATALFLWATRYYNQATSAYSERP